MSHIIDKLNTEILSQVEKFEKLNGSLEESVIKHFFVSNHNLIMEDDVFFYPDLLSLKKYEIWLNGRN